MVAPIHIAAGDRDGGTTPELFALYPDSSGSRIDVLNLQGGGLTLDQSFDVEIPANEVRGLGAADYDGDGRADIEVFSESGSLVVHRRQYTDRRPSNPLVRPPRSEL